MYCCSSFATVLICLAATFAAPTDAWSQSRSIVTVDNYGLRYGSHFGAATAASLQVEAEAQYLRSYGLMVRDLAEARVRHAEAQRLEEENSVLHVKTYFEKREINEAARLKKIGHYLTKRSARNEMILKRLENHPELNTGEIIAGVALNFLKNRLSSTAVAFRSDSMGTQESMKEVAAQLHLTAQTIHALQVRQSLQNGESFVFRLDEGRPLQADWWPPALRNPQLQDARVRFEKARARVLEVHLTPEFDGRIKELILSHAALEDAFIQEQNRDVRLRSIYAFQAYNEGKAFIQSLAGEIRRMEKLGPGQGTPDSLTFQGKELPELLAHMVRNGLEFAPAKPGAEAAYQQVFYMLRDLYVAVEADAKDEEQSANTALPPATRRASGS